MHYANGREARVGDPVVGKVYNTPGIVAGTPVSLTPGPDACSAQVQWTRAIVASEGESADEFCARAKSVLCKLGGYDSLSLELRGSQQHGSSRPMAGIITCRDYTHAGNLFHAEDAARACELLGSPEAPVAAVETPLG